MKERLDLTNKRLALQNAKVFYYQENMWIEAVNANITLTSLSNTAVATCDFINSRYINLIDMCKAFGDDIPTEIRTDINEILK